MSDSVEKIPLDRIDEPNIAMRTHMDEQQLAELAKSIKTYGLIQPVTLLKRGERYEIVAGHRRVTACRRAGIPLIEAIVKAYDDQTADSVRMAENLYREDVNPVDEGRYIRLMVDKHGVEPAKLAEMTGKSEAYLRARYDLLDFPDYLLFEVEKETVGLTAAQWLNRIKDENVRREYTRFAANGGITAKRAEAWFRSWEAGALPREASAYVPEQTATSAEPAKLFMPCVLCRHPDELDNLEMVYVHPDCGKAAAEIEQTGAKPQNNGGGNV